MSVFNSDGKAVPIFGLICIILTLAALPVIAAAQERTIPITPNPNDDLYWDREARLSIPQPTFEQFIEEVVGRTDDLFLAFQPTETLEVLGGGTYRVEAGETVSFRLQLYSMDPAQTYRVFTLIDEAPYAFNTGSETPYFQDVVLDPETTSLAAIEITTPPLTPGIHDISVVVMSPNDNPDDHRPSFERGLRLTLVAGSPRFRDLAFQEFAADPVASAGNTPIQSRLGITRPGAAEYWLETEQLTAGTVPAFDILRGYRSHNINADARDLPPPDADRFAIVVYANGEPVQLDEDFTLYAEVARDTLAARIPVEIPTVFPPGIHELVAVAIPHPGIPVCTLFGPSDGYLFLMTPEYTRITLEMVE